MDEIRIELGYRLLTLKTEPNKAGKFKLSVGSLLEHENKEHIMLHIGNIKELRESLKKILEKEFIIENMTLTCNKEALNDEGKKVLEFTVGKKYEFTTSYDPEGWEVEDDNENIEVFFDPYILFESIKL